MWFFIDFRERRKERNVDMRNIDWLPSIHTLTRNQTRQLLVHRTTFQPTVPPGQGSHPLFCSHWLSPLVSFSNWRFHFISFCYFSPATISSICAGDSGLFPAAFSTFPLYMLQVPQTIGPNNQTHQLASPLFSLLLSFTGSNTSKSPLIPPPLPPRSISNLGLLDHSCAFTTSCLALIESFSLTSSLCQGPVRKTETTLVFFFFYRKKIIGVG